MDKLQNCSDTKDPKTEMKCEKTDLQILNETVPCGFLRYTCEKQPRITYINSRMIEILRFPKGGDGDIDYLEMFKSNVFLMVPMEERRRFSKYLNRVYSADAPIAGEMALLRCDGTRAHMFGWVTKCINEQGRKSFKASVWISRRATRPERRRKTNAT